MHDLKFAQEILFALEETLKKEFGGRPVTSVTVNISLSPFSHVSPESLNAAFGLLIAEKSFKDVSLNIKTKEFAIGCRKCGTKTKSAKPITACPSCNSEDFTIEKGAEFVIESFQVQ